MPVRVPVSVRKATEQQMAIANEELEVKMLIAHEPEDFIARIDELKDIGFNHFLTIETGQNSSGGFEALKEVVAHFK
jgi:hypothetical protein